MLQQKHIDEVIDASSKFSKTTEEKLIQKMESSLKNREDQLKQLMDRLKDHVSSSMIMVLFYLTKKLTVHNISVLQLNHVIMFQSLYRCKAGFE